jgi:hypothetical protein
MKKSKLIISAFVNNFNYVNKRGTRKGFNLFTNSKLTYGLENTALELKQELQRQTSDSCPDALNATAFHSLVSAAFAQAKNLRIECAANKHFYATTELFGSKDRIVVDKDYKIPYKSGKFELALIKGLEATNSAIDNELARATEKEKIWLKELKDNCIALTTEIKKFNPQEVIIADRSITP